MNQKILSIKLENFGPFLGIHEVQFPEAGMALLKGLVDETKDGSGAGKSYVLNAIAFIFGECPFPSTELQSWYTDEPPSVTIKLQTDQGIITLTRKKGLIISGSMYKEPFKGKAAEAELDCIFGMDSKARAVVTYRQQREPGLFLSLSDAQKKDFLTDLLDLNRFSVIEKDAKDKADKLQVEWDHLNVQRNTLLVSLQNTTINFENAQKAYETVPDVQVTEDLKNNIRLLQEEIQLNQKLALQIKDKYQPELDLINAEHTNSLGIIYNLPEPLEVSTLKNQKTIAQREAQAIKDVYQSQKLQVEKDKAEVNKKISALQIQVSKRTTVQKALDAAIHEETCLNENNCPTCKQKWVGTTAQLKLENCKQIQAVSKKELESISEFEKQLEELKVFLSGIQQPVQDPNYQVFVAECEAIDNKVKLILEAFQAKKNSEATVLNTKKSADTLIINNKINTEIQALLEKQKLVKASLDVAVEEERRQVVLGFERKNSFNMLGMVRSQKEALEMSLKASAVKLEGVLKELNLNKDVEALVGRKGFLGVIFEDVLNEISAVTNDILAKVANVSHLTIEFRTEKENATGSISSRITPVIFNRGREVSFKAGISGGMQVAVELAIDLAFGDVVSRRRGSYPGWLILDETFHGLGGVAKESCLEILNHYSQDKLVLVVDHDVAFQGLFHNIIEVEQKDGLSRIVA
jgi:hypothetical protein